MITSRPYKNETDFNLISEFLNETYLITSDQINWSASRWQYLVHFVHPLNLMKGNEYWLKSIRIWEDDNKIVGVVSYEDKGSIFIQRHPYYPELNEQMILWAEENLSFTDENGIKKIELWINDNDKIKKDIISSKGYKKHDDFEYLRWHDLEKIDTFNLPSEYEISSLDIFKNIESKCKTIIKAFNSSGLPLELYHSMQSAPLYNPALDIVILNKNKEVIACGTTWFNPKTQTCYIEPMATLPEYQGKGLGKIVLLESLHRSKKLGAKKAFVGSYGHTTGAFYASCGFIQFERYYPWVKIFE